MIGVPTTSRTTRMPGSQIVWSAASSPGQRAEVAQQHDRRAGRAGRPRRAGSCGSAGAGRCRTRRRPASRAASVASRSSSEEAAGWRISTISWSPISLRAHWMMPMPMNSRARPRVTPSVDVGGAEAADGVRVRRRSRRRSRRRRTARAQIVDERRTASRPGARRASRPSGRRRSGRHWCAGQTRVGDRLVRDARPGTRARRSVVVVGVAHASTFFLVDAGGVGGDPDGEADQSADADEPGEQALADRAEAAEAEAAVVGLLLERLEVGDDVALLLGRQVAVGEGVHLPAGRSASPRRCACGSTPRSVGA